jgi:hypothetical protein
MSVAVGVQTPPATSNPTNGNPGYIVVIFRDFDPTGTCTLSGGAWT